MKDLKNIFLFFFSELKHGNYTRLLGPEIDSYLPSNIQYIPNDPRVDFDTKTMPNIPIMIGICSNEGAFMQSIFEIPSFYPKKKKIINE